MGISITEQSTVFLCSILMGSVLSFLYDIFRVTRKEIGHKNFVVMIEDILFWIICTAFMFVFLFNINSGQVRAFIFLGAAIGCILYYLTLSKLIMKLFSIIIGILRKIIMSVYNIILKPFIVIVIRPFYKIGGYATKKSKKYYRNFINIFKFKTKTVIIAFRKRNIKKNTCIKQKK